MAKKKPGTIRRGFVWTFKPFVNVHQWIGLRNLATMSRGVATAVTNVFVPAKSERTESFQEAIERLNLTPQDVQEKQHAFFRIAMVMGAFGVLCLFYMLYLLWSGHLAAGLIDLIVSLIIFAYAFRFHFWYFQLKNKKLGCTFKEWMDAKVSGEEQ